MTDHVSYGATEDKTMPAVVYGLYLVALATALPVFVGVIVAYFSRANAGPVARSHFEFQIRTFWLSIAWWIIGGLLILFGGILSFVLVGIPFFILGWVICGLVWVWFLVRSILGVAHLSRGEAYPRPYAWII
jgi:uncharacterized membrane protein